MEEIGTFRLWPTLLVAVLLSAACSGGEVSTERTVTLLTEDGPSEIVVSTAAPTTTTTATTTTAATNIPTTEAVTEGRFDAADEEATASETSEVPTTAEPETTTTTEAKGKETIPLAEEEVPAGIKMMDALEEFNQCLADDEVEFIGRPDNTKGPEDPVNQPEYIQALTSCAGRSGIVDAMQEFQVSRAGRTPDQIRADNEQFIVLTGCLRSKGWTVSDPVPDETGSLGPGEDFSGPDGDLDMDDIRSCISESNLSDE